MSRKFRQTIMFCKDVGLRSEMKKKKKVLWAVCNM